jgi:tetratricopeptide (TPR) repeat protein
MGELDRQLGDYREAATFYEESLALGRELGDDWNTGIMINNLGPTLARLGDYGRASALLTEALRLWSEMESRSGAVACLMGIAEVDLLRVQALSGDRPDREQGMREAALRAARLLGAAQGLADSIAYYWWPADKAELDYTVAAVRTYLDEASYNEAWLEGRAMGMEQAVEYALQEDAANE